LDNFKVFNDRYGYARGSEVIKANASIIENTVEEHGISDDFIGHIGGDDFIVVSSPDRYKKICNAIIDAFDKMIPDFYDPEDRKKGYIEGKTRQGQEMTFPIMTVSIAVVTNQHRKLINTIQVGELAAELKDYAKSIPGSLYVVDKRRKDPQQEMSDENVIRFPKKSGGASV
ncbi:MAG: diguanylate cyclase, partial [Nitrospirota bacterium]